MITSVEDHSASGMHLLCLMTTKLKCCWLTMLQLQLILLTDNSTSYLILFRCQVVDKAAPGFFHPLFPREVLVASGVLQGRVVSLKDQSAIQSGPSPFDQSGIVEPARSKTLAIIALGVMRAHTPPCHVKAQHQGREELLTCFQDVFNLPLFLWIGGK